MRYFYASQLRRMQNFGHEQIPFEDVMCQMNDLMEPRGRPGRFHLSDFMRPRNVERAGVFFDVLFNLGEFLSFEGRDPFLQKQIREEFPNTTLWQRYAHDECVAEFVRCCCGGGLWW